MIKGKDLLIKTDHKPIVFAFQQKAEKASPRQLRQLDYIGQFTTKITHLAGADNLVADAFSRIEMIDIPVIISTAELAKEQTTDEELKQILQQETQKWDLQRLQIDDSDTYLYCDASTNNIRPYIPKNLRRRIFDMTHGLSHPSGRATRKLIARNFIWPGMNRNITEWARTCSPCQCNKIHRHTKNISEQIPESRFHHVHIDIVGPLLQSKGDQYCLTMIDRFSRWPEAVPLKDITADTVATAFYTQWIARFGAPTTITTDQGAQFESQLFNALTDLIRCTRIRTTAYHPASSKIIERWHRSLKTALTCHGTTDWIETLSTVLLGLRTSYKDDIKTTAEELIWYTPKTTRGIFHRRRNI